MNMFRRRGMLFIACLLGLLFAAASPATAATGPVFELTSVSNTLAAPGGTQQYLIHVANIDKADTDGTNVTFTGSFPPGISPISASGGGGFECSVASQIVKCDGNVFVGAFNNQAVEIPTEVAPAAAGTLTASFDIEGGGAAASAHTVDPVRISPLDPDFGIDGFDAFFAGGSSTTAAARPNSFTTSIDFNARTNPSPVIGPFDPVEDAKDVTVDLPAGFLGSVASFDTCTAPELANGEGADPKPLCPFASQLGTASVRVNRGVLARVPIFNMVPPADSPARFGFNVYSNVVILDAQLVRAGGDYRLSVRAENIAQGLTILGNSITFWGVPSSPEHDSERACPGSSSPSTGAATCPAPGEPNPVPPTAFFRNPTSCTAPGEGLRFDLRADSWQDPGDFVSASVRSHQAPGYPLSPEPSTFPDGYTGPTQWGSETGIEDCGAVPFEPTLSVDTTTNRADSPTGLSVDIGLPDDCWDPMATAAEVEAALCQSDLKASEVTLPRGLSLNPSAAVGRRACTPAQAGVTSPLGSAPVEFDEAAVACPDASKIGKVEIATPALDDPLQGFIYLAQQAQNPFKSVIAMYLVAEGSGVRIKQAGEVALDPATGQITTTFPEVPQAPFSNIHFELFGGPRAALRTPSTCGQYATLASLTPWSGNGAVQRQSSFQVTECPNSGFDPRLQAGTQNPLAGTYSPFHVRLSREDGTGELAGLQLKLPTGLLANLSSVAYCPDSVLSSVSTALGTGASQIAAPSCPAGSQIGTVTVGAGAGPNPFYSTTGRLYWAGPYKGAPVSIAAVVPAVAGPFDLGTVVVRNALHVNPDTAEITAISDPLPSILAGIPLDLRDVRIDVDRPNYTLNPTSCEPKTVAATLTSTTGTTAQRSNPFQAAGCDRLGFKPKLAFALKGPVNRGAHPALSATYTTRPGDANLARAQVKLPPAAFLDQSHIGTVCTRVQFAAQACPAASIYGKASATSPILGYPLYGNVYLRSSSHQLPDLVADLRGPSTQPIEVALAGKTDSVKGALRNTFELVPDAPVTKFHLTLFGKKRGLIEMSGGFCANPRATVKLDAQNGRKLDANPKIRARCGEGGKAKKRNRRAASN